ncbi:MAG: GIY-YIG nuclease family protein [Bacteroidales bacterium]|nr:GIY-YIG nuclease family protein [Bacteroidales bacterium]
MPFVYILYSQSADKFYIGATTEAPEQRLQMHQDKYYGNKKFTFKYNDWTLFHAIQCKSHSQARKIENHIKNMKSKTYIQNLKKYSAIEIKLLSKYS